jgi:DNA primase
VIAESIIDDVRVRADIAEVIGEHVQLKRAGKDFKALCPFHNEKTPSFYVVPGKGSGFYKCFGCGEAGDVFDFLMKRVGLSFHEAVRELGRRVGVDVPDTSAAPRDEPHRALYEALAFADDLYRRLLGEDAAAAGARAYITQRGLDATAVERFGLGYAPAGWTGLRDAARHHGITDEVLLEAGLIKIGDRSDDPYDRLRDRLVFPILDLGNRTIGFGGRTLAGAHPNAPKYLNSPETPIYHKGRGLYGLNWSKTAIRREGLALVVEGYMDYVSLAARGVEHVVAALGTAMTEDQANLLARYAGRAVLLYDSDAAGLRATFKTGDALLRAGVHPLTAQLPAGEDPDSVVRRGGAAALLPHLDAATDVLERKLQMLDERGYFADIEGARRALDRLLPTLRAVIDPALRDIYLARVAQRTGVREATLEAELAATPRRLAGGAPRDGPPPSGAPEPEAWGGYTPPPRPDPRRGGRDGRWRGRRDEGSGWPEPRTPPPRVEHAAERLLLTILLRDPRRIADAVAAIQPADLGDPVHRELYAALRDAPAPAELAEPDAAAPGVHADVGAAAGGPGGDGGPGDGAADADGEGASDAGAAAAGAIVEHLVALGLLGAEAKRRAIELAKAAAEVEDGDRSFADAVADIKASALYVLLDDFDRRLARAPAAEHAALWREREDINRRLRELRGQAYKGHPRLHRMARPHPRTPQDPNEEDR